jgi:hypothetical protein
MVPTTAQLNSLAKGTVLTDDELRQFAQRLVFIADWVLALLVYPPLIKGWASDAKKAHLTQIQYCMTILRYVLTIAESMLVGTCPLNKRSNLEHRLLLEFYWLLHKLPTYLVQTDCEDCCNKIRFMGERKAGLQELWNILREHYSVQTLQRRMMLQLGLLKREGCIRSGTPQTTPR